METMETQGFGGDTPRDVGETAEKTTAGMQERAGETREQLSRRMSQASQKVNQATAQMKERTGQALENTSRGIDRVAMYIREKDTQAMMSDLQQVIRRYPGQSVVVGVVLGILVGRALR